MRLLYSPRSYRSTIWPSALINRAHHPARSPNSTNTWNRQPRSFSSPSIRICAPDEMGKPEALSQASYQETDKSHYNTTLPPSSKGIGVDKREETTFSNPCYITRDLSDIALVIVDDTKDILPRLQASPQENLSQSCATSVEERLLEIDNHDPSPEATARRAPKQFDAIVKSLGHHHLLPNAPWGFVVFRTVYGPGSDASFTRMLELLRETEETLSYYGQQYLRMHHELTVIEDEESLSGADSHTVRDAFRAWVADDLTSRLRNTERWGGQEEVRRILRSDTPVGDPYWNADCYHPATCMPTRWQFCLFVDENCLRSLDGSADPPGPHIKLLNTNWKGDRSVNIAEGWEDGETDDETEDVGWMYMDVLEHVETYRDLVDSYTWWEIPMYERPYTDFIP